VSVDDVKQPVKAVTEAKTMKVKSLTAGHLRWPPSLAKDDSVK
jgi:hypothetical protein